MRDCRTPLDGQRPTDKETANPGGVNLQLPVGGCAARVAAARRRKKGVPSMACDSADIESLTSGAARRPRDRFHAPAGAEPGPVLAGRLHLGHAAAPRPRRWTPGPRGRGRAFTRFDYSGHGESGGDFADGTISRWLEEARAVFERLRAGPQIVIGSSMGGWIALLLAAALRAAAEAGEPHRRAGADRAGGRHDPGC